VSLEETKVSKNIKVFLAMGVVAINASCGAREPETVADPEPVMAEPIMEKL